MFLLLRLQMYMILVAASLYVALQWRHFGKTNTHTTAIDYDAPFLEKKERAATNREVLVSAADALQMRIGDINPWPHDGTINRIGGASYGNDAKLVVIIIANCEDLQLGDNLARSIVEHTGSTNFVFVPLESTAYQILLRSYPDNVVPPPTNNPADDNKGRITKPWILRQLLLGTRTIIYNDLDRVWQSNEWDAVLHMQSAKNLDGKEEGNAIITVQGDKKKRGPIIAVQEASKKKKGDSNGLFFLTNGKKNRHFLKVWHQELLNQKKNPELSSMVEENAMAKAVKRLGEKFPHTIVNVNVANAYGRPKLSDQQEQNDLLIKSSGNLVPYNCERNEVGERPLPNNNIIKTTANRRAGTTNKKTLVILVGGVRGGDPTWNSLYRNLLEPNDADLALLLGGTNGTTSLHHRAKYVWEFPDFDDWNVAYDHFFHDKIDPNWKELLTVPDNAVAPYGNASSGAIVGLARAILVETLLKHDLVEKYDWFVVTRPDQYYECELDLSTLNPSKVYVPTGEDWFGICDRFLATGKKHILKALNTHLPPLQNPSKYHPDIQAVGPKNNAESFVARRWREDGVLEDVERFRRIMFTAYAKNDATRWQSSLLTAGFVEDGQPIHYKYKDEYYQAMSCRAAGGPVIVSKATVQPRHMSVSKSDFLFFLNNMQPDSTLLRSSAS